MQTLLIAVGAGLAFIVAYHTYGRWLGSKIFDVSASLVCPSHRLRDDKDYVPTHKSIVFGHHFTSIAGTGPIVGPAIAVMWGWLPALLWVVLGSIFIGAVHDFGALVVSLRNNGQTVGDIAGRVLNKRVRLLFLLVLFMALTIVLAIFGLVIAAVFRQYPAAIFPCLVQVPIAVGIGLWLHRKGVNILIPSIVALVVMYLTVIFGDQNTPVAEFAWLPAFLSGGIESVEAALHGFNAYMASLSTITWVALLLGYSYVASVLPVWTLLQPRDYINSLQLISALALIVIGLVVAAAIGGAPPVAGADRQPLEVVAPMVKMDPAGAPLIFPFLFITIACGAISGFHCLVSSGTSSKQLDNERDARFVGYGSMLTEGFLATLVILACVAGLGLGVGLRDGIHGDYWAFVGIDGKSYEVRPTSEVWRPYVEGPIDVEEYPYFAGEGPKMPLINEKPGLYTGGEGLFIAADWGQPTTPSLTGELAWVNRYQSWSGAGGLASTVGAFVDGSANFLKAMGIPGGVAVALMGVLVASFAGTTLDTACRLQRYVVQELAATFTPTPSPTACAACGYDLSFNVTGACPECGVPTDEVLSREPGRVAPVRADTARLAPALFNPMTWLSNKHGATIFAVVVALAIAAMPSASPPVSLWQAVSQGIDNLHGEETWSHFDDGRFFHSVDQVSGVHGAWVWLTTHGGKGGMILWPMFGATNQLLGGLAFMVIAFYLWRRGKPIWFLVLPLVFMLIMPAWALYYLLFVQGIGMETGWLGADSLNWPLIVIAIATLLLEVWMVIEAVLLFPRVKGVLERELPGSSPTAGAAEA